MNEALAGFSAGFLYLVAAGLLALSLKYKRPPDQQSFGAIIPAILAVLLHGLLLYRLIMQDGGLNFSFFNSLTLMAWSISSLLLLAAIRLPVLTLGIPLFIITALSIVLALLFAHDTRHPASPPVMIEVHIILSMLAYSVLSLASLQAILLYVQDYRLHQRKQDLLMHALPSLQRMEEILFLLISCGFILLTVALALGLPYTTAFFTHKIIFSIIAWLVFGILLLGRKFAGWRGKTAIQWTLVGIFSLLLAFFGSKLVLEIILEKAG